jgi:hypothetical protein
MTHESKIEYIMDKLSLLPIPHVYTRMVGKCTPQGSVNRLMALSYFLGQLDMLHHPELAHTYTTAILEIDIKEILKLMNYELPENQNCGDQP